MGKDGKVYAGKSGKAVSTYNSGGNFETNQKRVTYWEDKNTGEYIRETVTEKNNPNESRQYYTTTVGNKSTGDYEVKQSQQVCKNSDYMTGYDVIEDGSSYSGSGDGGWDGASDGSDYMTGCAVIGGPIDDDGRLDGGDDGTEYDGEDGRLDLVDDGNDYDSDDGRLDLVDDGTDYGGDDGGDYGSDDGDDYDGDDGDDYYDDY